MKVEQRGHVKSMERHVYTIPVNEFDRYKRRLKVPENAFMTFWYERKRKAPLQKNDWKAQWGTVAGIWNDYEDVEEKLQKVRSSWNDRLSY